MKTIKLYKKFNNGGYRSVTPFEAKGASQEFGPDTGEEVLKGMSAGAQFGSSVGGGLEAVVPGGSLIATGAGAVLGAGYGAVKATIEQNRAIREKKKVDAQTLIDNEKGRTLQWEQTLAAGYDPMGNEYATKYAKYGGLMKMENGGNVQQLSKNIVEFKGNSHEMGGIKEPVVNGRVLKGAEVEGGETMQGNFIFSEELGFAQRHKPLAKMLGKLEKKAQSNPNDKINNSTIARVNSQINSLKKEQEETKEVLGIENDLGEMKNGGLYKKFSKAGLYTPPATLDSLANVHYKDMSEWDKDPQGIKQKGYDYWLHDAPELQSLPYNEKVKVIQKMRELKRTPQNTPTTPTLSNAPKQNVPVSSNGKYVNDGTNQSYTDASGTYAITGKNNTLRYKGLRDKDFRTINDPNGIAAINKLNPSFQYTPNAVTSTSNNAPTPILRSSIQMPLSNSAQQPSVIGAPRPNDVDPEITGLNTANQNKYVETPTQGKEGSFSGSKTSVNWGNVASGLTPYLGVAANYMLNEKAKKLKLPQEKLTTPISLQRVNYDNQRAEADIQRGQLNTLTNRNLTNSAVASAVMAKNLGTTIRQKNAINESEMNANRMISNEEATRNKTIEQYNNTTQVGNEDRFYNRDRDYLQNKGQIATNLSSMVQKQRADKMQYDLEDRKIEALSKADAGRDIWYRKFLEDQKKANAAHALTTTEEDLTNKKYGGKVKSSLRKKVGC